MSNDDLKEIFGTDLEEELEGLVEVVDDANAVCSHIDKWYQEKLDELKQDLDDPRAYLLSLDGTYRDVVLSHTNTLPALRQVVENEKGNLRGRYLASLLLETLGDKNLLWRQAVASDKVEDLNEIMLLLMSRFQNVYDSHRAFIDPYLLKFITPEDIGRIQFLFEGFSQQISDAIYGVWKTGQFNRYWEVLAEFLVKKGYRDVVYEGMERLAEEPQYEFHVFTRYFFQACAKLHDPSVNKAMDSALTKHLRGVPNKSAAELYLDLVEPSEQGTLLYIHQNYEDLRWRSEPEIFAYGKTDKKLFQCIADDNEAFKALQALVQRHLNSKNRSLIDKLVGMLSPDRPNWSWLNRSLIDACFQIGGDALHNYVCEICDRESEWLKPDARLYWRYHGYRLMDVLHECIDIGLLPNKDYSTQIAELDRDNLYRYSEHSKLRQLIYDQKLTVTVHEKPCNVNLNELLDEINGATKKAEIRYAIAELSEDDETYMLSWVINDRLFRHISDGGGGAIHDAFAAVNLSLKLAGCETRFISIAYDECEFIAIDSDRMLPVLKKYALTHHFQNSWTIG